MTTKAIDVSEHGSVGLTGHGISLLQLLTLKQGLSLEAKGLRLTRKAPKCSTILRQRFGIRGSREKQMAQLDALIAKCREDCEQQNAQAEAEQAVAEGKVN